MLNNTRSAIGKMIDDIKSFSYHFNIVMQVMYFAYLLYAIGTERGILWLNISLAGLSILYFVFFVATYNKKNDTAKQVKKSATLHSFALKHMGNPYLIFNKLKGEKISRLFCLLFTNSKPHR